MHVPLSPISITSTMSPTCSRGPVWSPGGHCSAPIVCATAGGTGGSGVGFSIRISYADTSWVSQRVTWLVGSIIGGCVILPFDFPLPLLPCPLLAPLFPLLLPLLFPLLLPALWWSLFGALPLLPLFPLLPLLPLPAVTLVVPLWLLLLPLWLRTLGPNGLPTAGLPLPNAPRPAAADEGPPLPTGPPWPEVLAFGALCPPCVPAPPPLGLGPQLPL
mmetsp:Transcript_86444/g.231594  ORF Transcript_86444/g.231594 Transcript_86444/m.231594 type:complete len:217 (+) Transcript_86444:1497-2147(+)